MDLSAQNVNQFSLGGSSNPSAELCENGDDSSLGDSHLLFGWLELTLLLPTGLLERGVTIRHRSSFSLCGAPLRSGGVARLSSGKTIINRLQYITKHEHKAPIPS